MSPRTKPIINLAVLAHVDAGKTTLTEGMLFASGAIPAAGRVDDGTSFGDSLAVERARGISVRMSSTSFSWEDVRINTLDTPGHTDFSAEVERAVAAADCAVLIVCASEGVQAGTRAIWEALAARKLPTIVFANKLDRVGADLGRVLAQLSHELGGAFVPMQSVSREGTRDVTHTAAWSEACLEAPENDAANSLTEAVIEAAASTDDRLLEKYLEEGKLSFSVTDEALGAAVRAGDLFPVFCGTAPTGMGVRELLDGVIRYLPRANGDSDAPLSAAVYAVLHDGKARALSVRVFDGALRPRDAVEIHAREATEKVSELKKLLGAKRETVKAIEAGDTGVVYGLPSARAGDILGEDTGRYVVPAIGASLMTVRVNPVSDVDYGPLAEALALLAEEDPSLNLRWYKDTRELHLNVRGKIQIEILTTMLKDRFDLEVSFDPPSVIYKETPAAGAEIFERYWMPKPCWAIVRFAVEPLAPGSGVVFESMVSEDDVARRYQREIERHLPTALAQGPGGWEVTDLKVTLLEGEDHQVHTRPGDFAVATSMALMGALAESGTRLLEPVMRFSLTAPEDTLTKVSTDLQNMRATAGTPVFDRGGLTIEGTVPAATSMDYPALLASRTGGKGRFSTRFEGYRPCPNGLGESRPYRGINPLDRSKFILFARKAFG